ncbi:hypothetical protein B0H19DRAFT_1348896 [Mycena capillaripes]|nr:hypothetical protein B0H19DRAFT_1348896 [Mycena capillaripes]
MSQISFRSTGGIKLQQADLNCVREERYVERMSWRGGCRGAAHVRVIRDPHRNRNYGVRLRSDGHRIRPHPNFAVLKEDEVRMSFSYCRRIYDKVAATVETIGLGDFQQEGARTPHGRVSQWIKKWLNQPSSALKEADGSLKESEQSRYRMVSLRMKTGRVALRPEEAILKKFRVRTEKIMSVGRKGRGRQTPVELNDNIDACDYPTRFAIEWSAERSFVIASSAKPKYPKNRNASATVTPRVVSSLATVYTPERQKMPGIYCNREKLEWVRPTAEADLNVHADNPDAEGGGGEKCNA